MLQRLWRDLSGDAMSANELQQCIERCEALIPDGREGRRVEGQAQAEDAASALACALTCRRDGGVQEAAWAARCVYNDLAELARNREHAGTAPGAEGQLLPHAGTEAAAAPATADPRARAELARLDALARVERASADPLVQAELARQRRDVAELLGLDDRADVASVAAWLRDRARIEATALFG